MSLLKPTPFQLSHGDRRLGSSLLTPAYPSWACPLPAQGVYVSLCFSAWGREREKTLLCLPRSSPLPAQSPFPAVWSCSPPLYAQLSGPRSLHSSKGAVGLLGHAFHTRGCCNTWLDAFTTLQGSTRLGIPLHQSIPCSLGVTKPSCILP